MHSDETGHERRCAAKAPAQLCKVAPQRERRTQVVPVGQQRRAVASVDHVVDNDAGAWSIVPVNIVRKDI